MSRQFGVAAAFVAVLAVQGCGKRHGPDEAALAVQKLLAAVQAQNTTAFEALIDRPALRSDLRGQLARVARANEVDVDGGPSDVALDRMIDLDAFHLVRAGSDAPLAAAPTSADLVALIRAIGPDHVCLHDPGAQDCLLTFAKEAAGWRLVGMRASDLKIEIAPAPAKP